MGDPAIWLGWVSSVVPVVAAIVIWGRRILAVIRQDAKALDERVTHAVASGVAEGMGPVQSQLDVMDSRLDEIEKVTTIVVEVLEQLAEDSPKAQARLAEIERRAG